MIKKYCIICFFFLALGTYFVYHYKTIEIQPQQPFVASPKNTVFVFDLHGVVFQKNLPGMIRAISKAPLSMGAFITLINPLFWYDFLLLLYKVDSAENIIKTLTKKYPHLEPYIDISLDIANEQLPTQKTVAIIKKLKEQGFPLLVFSNIGITTFKRLVKKFPELFSYFDGYQVAEPKDNWLQKPDIKAYKKFIDTFDLHAYNIVFIDDKKENISAGQASGMYGVYFKAIQDLKKHIERLEALK